ncbi:MAG TPA: STAS domain-containing protein [Dongiaceae bacterium]|nr:STAS domain-containing protein [Dongiaceae bacterium]
MITFDGDLSLPRYPEVHAMLEAAKITKGRPIVVDLGGVSQVDAMIAGEIVLFVRRSLRYGATVVIVPPSHPNEWLTHAASIRDAHFRETREEALALVGQAAR